MHKEFLFFIKYPYTAGTIATMWIGSAILILISSEVPAFKIIVINVFTTVVLALIGFGGHTEA